MEMSFRDANLTTRVEAVRYICLVAILIALPAAADAQRDVARRGRSVQSQTASTPQDRPAAKQRPAAEQRPPAEQRQARERRSEQRQSAQQQQRPMTGLGPIGLPPAPATTTNTPWWERQGPPAWERKQAPWWERPQIDPYKTMNPARVMLDQERDARRLARHPRPVHPIYKPGYIAPPIPDFLFPVRDRLAAWAGVDPNGFAMALINEYRPGTPIGWHRDAPQYDIIAGVSLLSSCRMRLRPYVPPSHAAGQGKRRVTTHEIELLPRSAYVIRGEARSAYEHSIPAVTSLRYSITLRTLR